MTFAAGLFIASFFINVAAPSLNIPRKSFKHREFHKLREENRELRRSVRELRRELEEMRKANEIRTNIEMSLPSFEPAPPPRAVHRKYER